MAKFPIRPGDDLSGADLSNFDFYEHYGLKGLRGGPGADLQNCKFIGTNFRNSILYHADFRGADLSDADMSYVQCRETVFGRRDKQTPSALLLNSDFTGAYLGGSHLFGINASGAKFIDSNLEYCEVHRAVFHSANFKNANLAHLNSFLVPGIFSSGPSVDFSESNFVSADFSYADLRGANFSGANLTNTNFYGANIADIITDAGTVFTGAIGPDGTRLR